MVRQPGRVVDGQVVFAEESKIASVQIRGSPPIPLHHQRWKTRQPTRTGIANRACRSRVALVVYKHRNAFVLHRRGQSPGKDAIVLGLLRLLQSGARLVSVLSLQHHPRKRVTTAWQPLAWRYGAERTARLSESIRCGWFPFNVLWDHASSFDKYLSYWIEAVWKRRFKKQCLNTLASQPRDAPVYHHVYGHIWLQPSWLTSTESSYLRLRLGSELTVS